MRRHSIEPRTEWQAQAEAVGFTFHHMDGRLYWDESAWYEFSLRQVESLHLRYALHDINQANIPKLFSGQPMRRGCAHVACSDHRNFLSRSHLFDPFETARDRFTRS